MKTYPFIIPKDVASRDKLANINEKIIKLERQVKYLEAVSASLANTESIPTEGTEDILQ